MFDPYTGIAFTASNENILSNPELLTLENNTAKYCFSDFSFETHAFYDKKSKKIIEHEEILIDGEPYRVEFIEDDSCLLCGRIETINNKKIVSFIFYENGCVYVGDTVNYSIKDGAGMMQFPDGGIFIGVFKNDKNNGKEFTITKNTIADCG